MSNPKAPTSQPSQQAKPLKLGPIISELRKGNLPAGVLPERSSDLAFVLEYYFPRNLQDTGSHAQRRLTCRFCKEASGHRLEDENTFSWHEAYFHIKVDCKKMKERTSDADIKLFLAAVCLVDKPDFFHHTIRPALPPLHGVSPLHSSNTNALRDAMSEADFRIVRRWDNQKPRNSRAVDRQPKPELYESDTMFVEHDFVEPSVSRFRHPSEAEALLQLSLSTFEAVDTSSPKRHNQVSTRLSESSTLDIGYETGANLYTEDPAYMSNTMTEEGYDISLPIPPQYSMS